MILQRNSSARRESQWQQRAKLERAKQKSLIRKARAACKWDYEFRGNMGAPFEAAIADHEEVLLCGAAGTGKTLRILHFINDVCWRYPGARILIVRKVRADLAQSTLVTYERDNAIKHAISKLRTECVSDTTSQNHGDATKLAASAAVPSRLHIEPALLQAEALQALRGASGRGWARDG